MVVGGGLAGVSLAQYLECALPTQTEVVLLSAENHLIFSRMLPEVVGRTISSLRVVKARPPVDWMRFTPLKVPSDRVWTAKDDAGYISPWLALPRY